MKITRKQIKELGIRLHHSTTEFDQSYWDFKIRYKKHHSFHYFRYLDLLKSKIELIGKTRGFSNQYYVRFNDLYEKVTRHISEDLKLKREDYPLRYDLDLSHIDLTNCNEVEDYKVVTFEEMINKLNRLIRSKKG